jgi:hypothetical protein
MLEASFRAAKFLEIRLHHLYGAMAYLPRKLEHLSASLKIHLGKRVAKRMGRHPNMLQSAFALDVLEDFLRTAHL